MMQQVHGTRQRPRFPIRQATAADGAKLTGVLRPRERISADRLATWTYRDQKADVMTGKGLHGLEAGADGDAGGAFSSAPSCCATVEMNGLLGTVIRSTAYQQRPALHPDAEAIHDVVVGMHWPQARLIMHHGRMGAEPDWGAEQHLDGILRGGGIYETRVAETVEVRYGNRTTRRVEVEYCPLVSYPPDEGIAAMRELYRMWHAGLTELARRLSAAKLVRWMVDGVGVPAEPWRA